MPITFDRAMSRRNSDERGLPFEMAEGFDFGGAFIRQDTRLAYPERRFQAVGRIGDAIVMLVFTPTPDGFRVIFLRPASRKERKLWSDARR